MDFKFDRAKPFYPFVINYLVSLHGMVELFSRDFYPRIKAAKRNGMSLEDLINVNEVENEKQISFFKDIYSENLEPTRIIGDISLRSSNRKSIEISSEELSKELTDNHIYLLPFQLKAAGILLIMTYEISKDQYDTKDSIWNFFYHCRNAAAHGGQFNILNTKRFPAKWDNIEITLKLNKTDLFKGSSNSGLLSLGDPLYLLYEIEQNFIK
ncbi:MAG: hypothetical protein K2Q22_00200 [Cytophagales bacterium]|nr:hypothetical protein [Cytophagales bacterium]